MSLLQALGSSLHDVKAAMKNFLHTKLARTFLGLIALVLAGFTACSSMSDNHQHNFVAYSWSPVEDNSPNIIPFHWLKSSAADDLQAFVDEAVKATEAMPPGHRVLFSWDIHRMMMFQNNGDFLITSNGDVAGCNSEAGFIPYRSLWLNKGVTKVSNYFSDFFKLYSEAGGKLDVFVLDFEQGFSYWHLLDLVEKNYPCDINHYLDAIQNDSRFSAVRDALAIDDLKSIQLWHENDEHLKWLAYTWTHLANYIDSAVYQPLKDYYPSAEFSNYGYYYQSSDYDFPDIYGSFKHRYSAGVHVGTHQSREIYGWMNLPGGTTLAGVDYFATPFNAFRFAVNKLRAMLLSSPVPVSPWVAYKGFNQSHLNDNDYYQELIYHILLSGVDYLLYWNPAEQADYSKQDDRLLNQLISNVNALIDNRKLSYLTAELAGWLDDLLITKTQLNEEVQLWRLTVDIGINENISDLIIQSNPAKININDSIYEFNSMKVLQVDDALSDKGLWLISN